MFSFVMKLQSAARSLLTFLSLPQPFFKAVPWAKYVPWWVWRTNPQPLCIRFVMSESQSAVSASEILIFRSPAWKKASAYITAGVWNSNLMSRGWMFSKMCIMVSMASCSPAPKGPEVGPWYAR